MKLKRVSAVPHMQCTGCKVCADVCPTKAIGFAYAEDGFWYPAIDEEKCVDCGLCVKKCPAVQASEATGEAPAACYGAKTRNESTRWNSTSGGFFSELATSWIGSGGLVCGAIYGAEHEIIHDIKGDLAGIEELRQSKYAQSNTSNIYGKVKKELAKGNKVLFCGTPCQVEALKLYIGNASENLVTMDFVCCGISSPVVYRKYLDELEGKYKSKIMRVWFKNKAAGWRNIGTRIEFENGRVYFKPGAYDLFMLAFVTDALSIRNSCSACKYRKLPHASDLTIADFWGIEKVNPEMDDNRGLSAIIANTEKGKECFEMVASELVWFETTPEQIAQGNFTVYKPKEPSVYRDAFLKEVSRTSLQKAYNLYGSYTGMTKIKKDLALMKTRLKQSLKKRGLK